MKLVIDTRHIPKKLSPALLRRLDGFLDRQDGNDALSVQERQEAQGLVELADFLTLLNVKAERQNSV